MGNENTKIAEATSFQKYMDGIREKKVVLPELLATACDIWERLQEVFDG